MLILIKLIEVKIEQQ